MFGSSRRIYRSGRFFPSLPLERGMQVLFLLRLGWTCARLSLPFFPGAEHAWNARGNEGPRFFFLSGRIIVGFFTS